MNPRPYLKRATHAAGLLGPAVGVRRSWMAWRARAAEPPVGADGLALPPPRLRLRTCGNADPDAFVNGGRHALDAIGGILERESVRLADLGPVLELGCGCGRVLRHWATIRGPSVHGCDIEPELVRWCDRELGFASCVRNEIDPPLPYADRQFDLVYAISVFTHLPVDLQRAWIAELARVVKPGGFLLLTMHGEHEARSELLEGELHRFHRGEPVVLYGRTPGVTCAAFQPHEWVVNDLLSGLEVRTFVAAPQIPRIGQDVYLTRIQ